MLRSVGLIRGLRPVITALAFALLSFACDRPQVVAKTPDTLPASFTDQEFWRLINDFSEVGGDFPSDNFVSNESGYQAVIPDLQKTVKPGGVYIGVGPEQNFTYILALQPQVAFIIDIRRQNMLEHLFYKALMEMSANRVEFLSRLFGRPVRLDESAEDFTPDALLRSAESSAPVAAFFNSNIADILKYLEIKKSFPLLPQDEAAIRHVARAFFLAGARLSYQFNGKDDHSTKRMPTYSELMTEDDGLSQNWNFLASEDRFQTIQHMQRSNLIVPLVGDFAGDKAIVSVAQYAETHRATVHAFYTSNVEEYLFQDSSSWKRFYKNASALPTDPNSVFIRYVLHGREYGRGRTSLISIIASTLRMESYYDVVHSSR